MRRHSINILSSLAALVGIAISFQNCGVTRPSVDSMSSTLGYVHNGLEVSCNQCHEDSRPKSSASFLNYNPMAPFDVAYHGGTRDCSICHGDQPNVNRTSADWARGFFSHKITLTDCTECHAGQRPVNTAAGTPHPTTGDCLSCHQPTLAIMKDMTAANYSSLTTALWKNASGIPTSLVWDQKNDVPVTVQTPAYGLNKILVSLTPNAQTLHMTMNHATTLPGVNMATCTTCHSNTGSYAGGLLHDSLTAKGIAQPTTCLACHSSTHPLNVPAPAPGTTTAFVGIAASQVAATNPSRYNHADPTTSADCLSCHAQPNWATAAWNNGKFHNRNNTPATCTECHAPTRPAGVVGATNFNHGTSGTGECVGCHITTRNSLATKTVDGVGAAKLQFVDWRGAIATPTGLVGAATITVAAVKLVTTGGAVTGKTASNQTFSLFFNHSGYQVNCAQCHAAGTFAGAKFHPNAAVGATTCKTCHTNSLPTFILGYGVAKPLDHASATVASKDCLTCHAAYTANTANLAFKDGTFHAKVGTQPTSCRECHAVKTVDQPIYGSMDHKTIGGTDCITCHKFPGTGVLNNAGNPPNWKGATAGAPATISMTPPTGSNLGNLNIAHPSMPLAGESCASCHGTNTAAKIIGYDHANPPAGARCLYCHTSTQQVVGVNVTTRALGHKGVGGNTDCVPCHRPALPTWNATTKVWTGGRWDEP